MVEVGERYDFRGVMIRGHCEVIENAQAVKERCVWPVSLPRFDRSNGKSGTAQDRRFTGYFAY
jgi:hypothetical protein